MEFLDENGMRNIKREMSTLAAELAVDGYARMKLRSSDIKYLQKLSGQIAKTEALVNTESLRRLAGSVKSMQAAARQVCLSNWNSLPACGQHARISFIATRLVSGGDRPVDIDVMQCALHEFDVIQNLTMEEYWAFPDAVLIAVCEKYIDTARQVIATASEYELARKWVSGEARNVALTKRQAAFFEHSLQLAMDMEKPEIRLKIENILIRMDDTPDNCIKLSQERAALMNVRVGNLMSSVSALQNVDWQKVFENASCTETELQRDPDNVYSKMTAASRAAVRKRLSMLAKKFDIGENTVAKCAVNAAAKMPIGDIRHGVCWWLYDDAGNNELASLLGVRCRIPRLRPDPFGYKYMTLHLLSCIVLSVFLANICGSLLWIPVIFPLIWKALMYTFAQVITRVVEPRTVLRMDYEQLPDSARTLVAIPALLTSPKNAREICRKLETIGCLENDENIDFVLIGDFKDSLTQVCDTDAAIMEAACDEIDRINAASHRYKYFYLQRRREYAAVDGIYRGKARKRGAIMELCRLATGREKEAFWACGNVRNFLFGKYDYLVTLDADTCMLPGTASALVGAISHPLNKVCYLGAERRGFAVMQPLVELDAEECVNPFVRIYAGTGGLNTYSGIVSDMFHDISGNGAYCGKAVIDMRAFLDCVDGRLDEERILSHDFIEGLISGTGHINDIAVFDGFPVDYHKWVTRVTRWTRGDWQLLPEFVRKDISLLGKYRMLSNLMESLSEFVLLTLFILSLWIDNAAAFSVGIGFAIIVPGFQWIIGDRQAFMRGSFELATLPATAYARIDAIIRALWRTYVSKQKLLDWVTSAEVDGDSELLKIINRVAVILLIPGLFNSYWIAPAAALGVLFLIAPGLSEDMSTRYHSAKGELPFDSVIKQLARDTWRYFERYVNDESNFLPPDNVQIDPDKGIACRTSPTNVAMYLLSCLCANRLGFIDENEMLLRMGDTLDTLERLEKWHGNLYNWYSTDTLDILNPRYVSSVDSGNLAASLMLCERACGDERTAVRFRNLVRSMDLSVLYDSDRKLFHIGLDAERDRFSESYYDLLASESRILSFTAIMLGQIPVEHWMRLGRPVSGDVLMSWSGTMFEYFMPALLMPSAADSMLGRTYRGVIKSQMDFANGRNRPWGVSESGYHTFDADMNYQYRAFGIRNLSMSGTMAQDVVAPYGACLALQFSPEQSCENVMRMVESGWHGECGLYEAVDFVRREPRIVKSWMAHHQGMALCAMCNYLSDGYLQECFMSIPQARALRLLLNEQAVSRIKLQPEQDRDVNHSVRRERGRTRAGNAKTVLADTALLGGGGATALICARGDVIYSRNGIYASRFIGDLLRRSDSQFTFLTDKNGRKHWVNSNISRCMFGEGEALYSGMFDGVEYEMRLVVSPDDGALVKLITLKNTDNIVHKIYVTDGFEVAIMDNSELRAHPVFHRLFCNADLAYDNAIIYSRKMRDGSEGKSLVHVASCRVVERETDWLRLMGRNGKISPVYFGTNGPQTDPCSALKTEVEIGPGETRRLAFAVCLCEYGDVNKLVGKYSEYDMAERACRFADSFVRSAAEFAELDNVKCILAERACALLIDPKINTKCKVMPGMGTPGEYTDLPRLSIRIDRRNGLAVLRDAVRMHEYCRLLGFEYWLIIVYDHGNEYEQPLRDSIHEIIGASHLRDMNYRRGGVVIYDAAIDFEKCAAIERGACICLDSNSGYWEQIRKQLGGLRCGDNMLPVFAPVIDSVISDNKPMNYGEMDDDGFVMTVSESCIPPAPWSNILTAGNLGMLVTERGGGFIWHKNSRLCRITGFDNDVANEGWGCMLYVIDEDKKYVCALPGINPDRRYCVKHYLDRSVFECEVSGLRIKTEIFGDATEEVLVFRIEIENTGTEESELKITGFVDWLMGADSGDNAYTRTWNDNGVLYASGTLLGTGFFTCNASYVTVGPDRSRFLGNGGIMSPSGLMETGCGGVVLTGTMSVKPGEKSEMVFFLGCSSDTETAQNVAERLAYADVQAKSKGARLCWTSLNDEFEIKTGDLLLDRLVNGFLLKQTLDGRIRGRTGFYQAGGAYGFRDQLQDMLAVLPYDFEMVRNHILTCAQHQFQDGDVMHWWHPPMTGVRTHISDDMLFLPFVTAHYVLHTGDEDILECEELYLKNIEIPEGREDIYAEMELSGETGTLKEHCMRAFRRACRRGQHGLLLMGSGDWNDGMNRVGSRGRGESVWLSMFFVVCARLFADIIEDGMDRAWLLKMADELMESIQKHGWDGEWYLRAYDDDGEKLGSSECDECMIDLIAQGWSVLSDCPDDRAQSAMDAAWKHLYDSEHRMLRLLTPPFTGKDFDPGYIAAYPPGVRENGGQYTHAACWYLIALAKQGDAVRAKELLMALLPLNHALTTEDADLYRTEPYVMAADIYGEFPYAGRGGWTWYTGAAGWYLCAVRYLLGYERRGNRVRMHALEGIWERPQITLRFGNTRYTLVSDAAVSCTTVDGVEIQDDFVTMADDGGEHVCMFAMRKGDKRM